MKRFLGEPLVHFLLLGAALFVAFGLFGRSTGVNSGSVVVTKGQIASMVSGFNSIWQRPPTQGELEGLIQDRVAEEIYCREAVAMGLDKDDTIIRRRLRQKMEFLSEDAAAQAEPSDAELQAYLQAHPDSFRAGARTDGGVPALRDVHDAVAREWANAKRLEANDAFYQSLRKKYSVTIERP